MERAVQMKKKLIWILERLNISKVKAKISKLEMLNILKVKLVARVMNSLFKGNIANPTCTWREETWNIMGYLKEKGCKGEGDGGKECDWKCILSPEWKLECHPTEYRWQFA